MDILKKRKQLQEGQTISDMKLRVVYYARVSTDKKDQMNSLENQKAFYRDYITSQKNWIYSGEYIDFGVSGSHTKRPSLKKMIFDALSGDFDLIITKEISRFSRSTVDSIKYTQFLLSAGVAVFFHNDNLNTLYEDCELRLTIMSSIAQDELRRLKQRVNFGIEQAKKDGKILGNGNIYGYIKKDGKLVSDKNAQMVKDTFDIYVTGKYGMRAIAKILTEKGYKNQKGGEIKPYCLTRIIKNPVYMGVKDEENESYKIEPIITKELWHKANEVAANRSSLHNRKSQPISKQEQMILFDQALWHITENKELYKKYIDTIIDMYKETLVINS